MSDEFWGLTDGEWVLPTNDFAAYRESDRDERSCFDPEVADQALLINQRYPEKGANWGVDGGQGWVDTDGESASLVPDLPPLQPLITGTSGTTFETTSSRYEILPLYRRAAVRTSRDCRPRPARGPLPRPRHICTRSRPVQELPRRTGSGEEGRIDLGDQLDPRFHQRRRRRLPCPGGRRPASDSLYIAGEKNGVFPVESITERSGGTIEVDVGGAIMVERFVDPGRPDEGSVYTVGEGTALGSPMWLRGGPTDRPLR